MLFSFSVGQYGVKKFKYFNSTCFKFVVAKENFWRKESYD